MLKHHLNLNKVLDYLIIILFITTMFFLLGGTISFILITIVITIIVIILNSRKITNNTCYTDNNKVIDTLPTKVPFELQRAYREYLKSEEWYELRRLTIKRDKHRCVRCGYIGYLQVHHTNYKGIDTMSFTINQLETVCDNCHNDIHSGLLPMKKEK